MDDRSQHGHAWPCRAVSVSASDGDYSTQQAVLHIVVGEWDDEIIQFFLYSCFVLYCLQFSFYSLFFFTSIFINWKMVIIVEAIMNLAGVTVCERYSELDEFNLRKFQEKNCGNVEGIDGKVE